MYNKKKEKKNSICIKSLSIHRNFCCKWCRKYTSIPITLPFQPILVYYTEKKRDRVCIILYDRFCNMLKWFETHLWRAIWFYLLPGGSGLLGLKSCRSEAPPSKPPSVAFHHFAVITKCTCSFFLSQNLRMTEESSSLFFPLPEFRMCFDQESTKVSCWKKLKKFLL